MNPMFDELINTSVLSELRFKLSERKEALSLPQAKRIRERANELQRPNGTLRLGIVHSFTSDLLNPWLQLAASLQGLDIDTYHAPYGLNLQEAQAGSGLSRHEPDVTLLLLQREDLHPSLNQPSSHLTAGESEALMKNAAERIGGIVRQFREQPIGQLVITLLPSIYPPGQGYYDTQAVRSETLFWAQLKSALAGLARDSLSSTFFLDLDLILQRIGSREFFDLRLWFSARYPFTPLASLAVAQRVVDIGAAIVFPKAKVIVLDADNTLWGGIIGEDGLHGIALGPDYPGNAYLEFQRRLLHLQQRGFILALCSKNNPADVDQALDGHPHQLLKNSHFAAKRVNWLPKPDNLISLAEELKLGLESFVFVDDSDHECAAVRHLLPQVEVIQAPNKPVQIPFCLDHVARLEVLYITDEDRAKTQLYAQERHRKDLKNRVSQGGGDLQDYLRSLQMVMTLGVNDTRHLKRLAQLTQKTNQFNLTTRRYTESQMREFFESDDRWVMHFSLADVFGDSGVVGLTLWQATSDGRAIMDSFLMSCRVIGRDAESAFLNSQIDFLAERGITDLIAEYLPTPKNALVKDFLPRQGFVMGDDERYYRDLRQRPAIPESDFPIAIEWAD